MTVPTVPAGLAAVTDLPTRSAGMDERPGLPTAGRGPGLGLREGLAAVDAEVRRGPGRPPTGDGVAGVVGVAGGAGIAGGGPAHGGDRVTDRSAPAIPARLAALRRRRAEFVDGVLADLAGGAGVADAGMALAAVGGYGRRELSPHSDLDLILLFPADTPDAVAAQVAERLWYPIWDSGVRLDHSVRTVAQARQVGRVDLPAALGMLDLRHIAGETALTADLRRLAFADWRADAARRLPDLLGASRTRAERSGELAYAAVPDLKQARGGLRDLAVMRAVAASWVADCPHQGLPEVRDTLLDIRDALRLLVGRAVDRVQVQDQDALAAALHLPDRDELMRRISGIGRVVAHAADLTWYRVGRALSLSPRPGAVGTVGTVGAGGTVGAVGAVGTVDAVRTVGAVGAVGAAIAAGISGRTAPRRPIADGIVGQDGEAVLARSVDPASDPALPLRLGAAAALAGIPVSPAALARAVRGAPPMPVPWPAHARRALIALLGAGDPLADVWESLDLAGVVGALLPGWERLRSLPQRDPVHRHTVDRHLVQTAIQASVLVRRVDRPDLLLLAALLHDIGKGTGRDHSVAGAEIAPDWLARMGIPRDDAALVVTLIREHLLLAQTAVRRDPDDPATVEAVAAAVGSVAVLELLAALTEADATAAGPAAWTPWKARQVGILVSRVRALLGGGGVCSEGDDADPGNDDGDAAPNTGGSPSRAATAVEVRIGPLPDGLAVQVQAPDRRGLVAATAGVFALHRMTIRSASVRTSLSGARQDWVVAPQFGDPPDAATLRADLTRALTGGWDVAAALARRRGVARDAGRAAAPVVTVVAGASRRSTVLEVRARDVPALVFRVASAVCDVGVDVVAARVDTYGADAVDVFYLRVADRPLDATEQADVVGAVTAVVTAVPSAAAVAAAGAAPSGPPVR